ncbi:MAG: glutamine synthetase type III [Candidatus Auribacter fodinae]|jgi:glutamine synthetase|uniref:Glutamine synthetase type III n=1 Tax=Candidatus Auribacter fodinae TaxID=2093366 RepID=A0A3A4RAW9_9BACT|nr:MAG: glutamine synthetase type III [Candidatus Auribacter fodinae]
MNEKYKSVTEIFGANVFNDSVMRERLPKEVYKSIKKTIEGHQDLDPALASVIANAMKDWAIEKGATHFCHWFQPMTGLTAEKHDSFISPTSDGRTMMEFSGKELFQGEPDASSFPSGGLRATFEARGYTAWDCTSPVFVKEDGENITLYIPSAFCSYTGQALDKKTPLLKSMNALNKQAMRVLKALGNTTSRRVVSTLGAEQEYFLIDRSFFEKRLDLVMTGRTLFGAMSPRGQEMEDHYFGTLHERVASFMHEVNIELWKLGVSAKTQHNEVAPAQYELAPVFATVNVATDHNQLSMEILQKVANRHDFVCLLNEKPFAGVNGSGKHNNWSMSTDDGINLLDPGKTPHDNMVFLVMLCSVIRAVDKYSKLLRASVANSGNEHRLGANEAPPAIVSIFLGTQLTDIIEQLAKGNATSSKQGGELKLGVSSLPPLPKDCTDRNRTSPFAFTGNKFEFRMVGSSQSTGGPMFVLNTIVADVLAEVADELEKAKDVKVTAQKMLSRIATEHSRIIFNGDNYTDEWVKEAQKRKLPNIPDTIGSLETVMVKEHIDVFERQEVLTKAELGARTEILIETYVRQKNIEALTMLNIAKRQILPAAIEYSMILANTVESISAVEVCADAQKDMLKTVSCLIGSANEAVKKLEAGVKKAADIHEVLEKAECFRDTAIPAMNELRKSCDALELNVKADLWPLPTYAEMLFLR